MEKFNGMLEKDIDLGFISIKVVYNPYLDEWTFELEKNRFVFKGVPGRMVYEMLSVMKWREEGVNEGSYNEGK